LKEFQKFAGVIEASRIQDKVKGVGFDWEEPSRFGIKFRRNYKIASRGQLVIKMEAEFGMFVFDD
jgi:hypothetical protein